MIIAPLGNEINNVLAINTVADYLSLGVYCRIYYCIIIEVKKETWLQVKGER
jgi:hypothetical protein